MRATTLIATLALTGGLIGASAAIARVRPERSPSPPGRRDARRPIQLDEPEGRADQARAASYTDFREIARQEQLRGQATDPQGQRVEMDVDPVTGDVLKTEVKRSK